MDLVPNLSAATLLRVASEMLTDFSRLTYTVTDLTVLVSVSLPLRRALSTLGNRGGVDTLIPFWSESEDQ